MGLNAIGTEMGPWFGEGGDFLRNLVDRGLVQHPLLLTSFVFLFGWVVLRWFRLFGFDTLLWHENRWKQLLSGVAVALLLAHLSLVAFLLMPFGNYETDSWWEMVEDVPLDLDELVGRGMIRDYVKAHLGFLTLLLGATLVWILWSLARVRSHQFIDEVCRCRRDVGASHAQRFTLAL